MLYPIRVVTIRAITDNYCTIEPQLIFLFFSRSKLELLTREYQLQMTEKNCLFPKSELLLKGSICLSKHILPVSANL